MVIPSFGHRLLRPFSIALVLVVAASACSNDAGGTSASTGGPASGDAPCSMTGQAAPLPGELAEASGAAVSRDHQGVIWTHNDSGSRPELFAIDTLGHILARIAVDVTADPGNARDWEDIAIGECSEGTCLYIADIGDNAAARTAARILRIREPSLPGGDAAGADAQPATAESFFFRYPDGALDAEAIFVLPGERVYVVSKGRSAAVAVYQYPGPLRADTVILEHIQDLTAGLVQLPDQVTGGAASADGSRVILRTYSYLRMFDVARDGTLEERADRMDLAAAAESQGEAVALGRDGAVFLLGEKGFDRTSGTLAHLACR